jgi:hypothetical protein
MLNTGLCISMNGKISNNVPGHLPETCFCPLYPQVLKNPTLWMKNKISEIKEDIRSTGLIEPQTYIKYRGKRNCFKFGMDGL